METVSVLLLLLFAVVSPAAHTPLRTFHLIEKKINQTEARAACRENYTDLVTVYSDEDNAALTDLTDPSSAWIGLYRSISSVKWSNGDDVTFSNLTGDCGTGSCCAAMKSDGSWESLQCTVTRNFMCYKEDVTDHSVHLILEPLTWYEAQSYCRRNFTDLVSIRDQNQNEAVKIRMNSSFSFWIGLLRDDWEWADGGSSAYRNWSSGQPRLSTDCAVLRKGKWEAKPCSNNVSALCYSISIHISDGNMTWDSALDYCKKDNRKGLLHIESDLDQKLLENELKRRGVSGPLWVGFGQQRLSDLLKSSSKLSLGPWTNRTGVRRQKPPSTLSGATEEVEETYRTVTDVSALRAVCEV